MCLCRIDDISQYTKRLKYQTFFMNTLPFSSKVGIHGVSKESITFPALELEEVIPLFQNPTHATARHHHT